MNLGWWELSSTGSGGDVSKLVAYSVNGFIPPMPMFPNWSAIFRMDICGDIARPVSTCTILLLILLHGELILYRKPWGEELVCCCC